MVIKLISPNNLYSQMLSHASTLTFFLSVAAATWSTDTESSVQHPDAHVEGFVVTVHLDLQAFGAGLDGLR